MGKQRKQRRAGETPATPATTEQAGSRQEPVDARVASARRERSERQERTVFIVAEAVRARVWELHLRGMPKARIAREPDVALHPETVTRIIREAYKEVGQERKSQVKVKLDAAVARLRRLQEQAWADHDADDAREQSVLALALSAARSEESDEDSASDEFRDESRKPRRSELREHNAAGSIRYQSQRSQYLRVIMDAEKEIARLEGLYEATDDTSGAIVFRIERVGQSGLTVISDPLASIAAPTGAQAEGSDDGGDPAAG